MSLPAWADVLIVAAIPVILLGALWLMGDEPPGNTIEHHQEGGDEDDPDVLLAA